jgi:RecB family exonuclease
MEPITVSYSELDTFRQCPLKWYVQNVQRWQKPDQAGSGRSRGTLWHAVMQAHYQSLRETAGSMPDWQRLSRAAQAVHPILNEGDGIQTEDQELAEWMYAGYVDRWGVDPKWEIVEIEESFTVELPRPADAPDSGRTFLLKVKIDLGVISREHGRPGFWVVDSKSGANLERRGDLDLADQFGLYVFAKRQQGIRAVGSLYSGARTTRNTGDFPGAAKRYKPQTLEQRFEREQMSRTDLEVTRLAEDAWIAADEAYGMLERRGGRVYSAPDPGTCKWKCDMREAHLLMRKHKQVKLPVLLRDFGFVQYHKGPKDVPGA